MATTGDEPRTVLLRLYGAILKMVSSCAAWGWEGPVHGFNPPSQITWEEILRTSVLVLEPFKYTAHFNWAAQFGFLFIC